MSTCPKCGSDDTREQTQMVRGQPCPEEQCRECRHKWVVERATMTGADLARHHRLTLEEWEAAQDAAEAMEAAMVLPLRRDGTYKKGVPAFRGTTADEIIGRVASGWRRQTALLSVACGIYRDKVRAGDVPLTRAQMQRRERVA
jgi:hypothetical protein